METKFFKKKLRAWINNVLSVSSDTKADILKRHDVGVGGVCLSDYSFGWKDVIEITVEEKKINGLLLTGPVGSGKHTAAEIAVNFIANQDDNYEILYLSDKNFIFDSQDIQADQEERQNLIDNEDLDYLTDDIVHTFLDKLLDEFYNDEVSKNVCIVLENISKSDISESIYDRLSKYIGMYESNEDFPSLFVILIEPDEKYVSSSLRKYLRLMKMSLPNFHQRKQMMINRGIDAKTAEAIANSTENFNYSQIRDLAENIAIWREIDEITSEFYENFIYTQSPESVFSENSLLYSEKIQFYRKIENIIDYVPQLLEKIGQISYVGVPTAKNVTNTVPAEEDKLFESTEDYKREMASIAKNEKNAKSKIEEESTSMTLCEMMNDVIGKEFVSKAFNITDGSN